MGVLYSVVPLDAKVAAYLRKSKTEVPKKLPRSRMPTPAELQRIANSFPKVQATVVMQGGLLKKIDLADSKQPAKGPWTTINILENTGDDEPCDFYFEKGWPSLIVDFLIRLTSTTGPLTLVPDTGDRPILIKPSTRVSEALKTWEQEEED